MKIIKMFEEFDFSKKNSPIPIVSQNDLTMFYSCDDCNALWKSFNENLSGCNFCKSSKIEELSESEYYSMVEDGLEEGEIEVLRDERKKESENLLDMFSLGKNNNRYNVN